MVGINPPFIFTCSLKARHASQLRCLALSLTPTKAMVENVDLDFIETDFMGQLDIF